MLFKDVDEQEFSLAWHTYPNLDTLAKQYGVHVRTIQHWARRFDLPSREGGVDRNPAIAFPENPGPEYSDFLRLALDRCIVIHDCEIPDHDIEMFEHVITIARHHEVDTLIIVGDFVSNDAFSKWARVHAYRLMFRDQVDITVLTLKVFLQTFKRIIYLPGNHERWLPKAVDGEITMRDILGEIPGLEVSDYPYLYLTSGGEEILLCHPKEYRRVPLSAPLSLCQSRHMHIWCGHSHRQCMGWDPSGKYWLVEGGHCRSEPHTLYKRMEVTSHPKWNSGFGMIVNGYPFLFNRHNLDFWLGVKLKDLEVSSSVGLKKPSNAKPKPKAPRRLHTNKLADGDF